MSGEMGFSSSTWERVQWLAGNDGDASSLSTDDLQGATMTQLRVLAKSMASDGQIQPAEQELVQAIVDLTTDSPPIGTESRVRAYDFASGKVQFTEATSPVDGRRLPLNTLQQADVISILYDEGIATRGAAPGVDNTIDVDYVSHPQIRQAGNDAELELAGRFGFDPANPHDLDAVRAFASNLLPEEVPEFIGLYMTAHFAHPGDNTEWAAQYDLEGQAESVLFGDPPQLDQLPDGRFVVDCQGFSKLAEILFHNLLPGEETGDHFYEPLEVPGHELGVMRFGDQVAIVDNNRVTVIPAGAEELEHLAAYVGTRADCHAGTDATDVTSLNDAALPREEFPAVYDYLDSNWAQFQGQTLYWDQGHTLRDG